jgi:hypothetical protein
MNKKILGTISPLYGVMSGQGAFGQLADKGLLGLVPRMIASKAQEKDEEKKRREAEAVATGVMPAPGVPQPGMKKGGKVSSASKRADGCAQRGKTRGKIV